jgi:pantothenate kinase
MSAAQVDMLVGDIYGDRDYSAIGLSASTIASSFGKVVAENKDLEDYDPADIAVALTRMVSYNISHLAYLNAKAYGIQRVFFGGFYIRGHPYTMETISYAIRFWSKVRSTAVLGLEGVLFARQIVWVSLSVGALKAFGFCCCL